MRSASGGGKKASTTATAAGVTKASRQSISPSSPPTAGASAMAAVWTAAKVPTARPRVPRGTTSASPASRSGVRKALAVPDSARAPMNRPIVGATAAASDVAP
jgi:hypothetical protein